ncbi:predicted protein [Nematostella vectensis]|uniref:Guanine nucleotide-binding protein subunit beta-like protein n=1 Tax=Nematostella vectensis TaxID=45351 RepID=A7SGG7_NEMVE|nr:predicted protein [Nematostella vectensis]|eukprot:XP_001629247.1 predicted protein [Nematostella vectensis]
MADTSDLTNYVLPASPNWYCSTGTDFSITGLYGFAAKKCVYLLDVNGPVPAFRGQFTEHTDRVSSVRFCPHALHPGLCASGADDKTVRLWDVETKGVLANHTTHTAKVTSISWSPQVKDLILSADEKGTVIAWYYNKNTVHSTCPIQEYIFCVESSSVSSQQAAVGGELLLWDLSTPSPKDKVHVFGSGHSRIVFNVSCTPCGTKLMTTSMDRQVILWDVARCQQICTIATLGGYVYAMAISPLDPGTLALGVGDNMIRVWHTTSESAPYDAISLWQGIKSKVMMLAGVADKVKFGFLDATFRHDRHLCPGEMAGHMRYHPTREIDLS